MGTLSSQGRHPTAARYLFLRQAWRSVVGPDDQSWMSEWRSKNPNAPGGALGPAMDRILAAGAQAEDLTTVVRVMQWRLLAALCVLLDDPHIPENEVSDIWWRLFLVDEDGKPVVPIDALIGSVLETDPTGREMRPSSATS
jgi:hypothetical protein